MPDMRVLKEREVRRKPPGPRARQDIDGLPESERANVRRVLKMLHTRYGSWDAVGAELGLKPKTVQTAARAKGKPTAGIALRVARLVAVPVEDVLSGAFPKPGSCPMCGRGGG